MLHGISMGGHMATLGATVCPEPVGVVPCLAWSSASLTFTKGVMSQAIPWDLLEKQLVKHKDEFVKEIAAMCASELNAFNSGVEFIRNVDKLSQTRANADDDNYSNFQLPFINVKNRPKSDNETVYFMRGIMDECTHLKNFAVPVDPSLCVAVAAEKDAYQPRDGVRPFHDIWPGAEVRYLPGAGHVSSYLFKQNIFRKVIYEVLDKLLLQQKTKQF